MGTNVQTITKQVSLIASKHTWIEGAAIQQLKKTAELDGMVRVAGMPDLHPGRGYPIGAAFYTRDKIYPALVGNDIGCGMSLWQTNIKTSKVNLDKFAKKFDRMEAPLDGSWHEMITQRKGEKAIQTKDFDLSLGTIGGGNHFAEFQAIDEVYDPEAINALGLDKKQLQLLVHSGSRGLGQSILTQHIRQFNHDGLTTDSEAFHHYMQQHDEAVRWAELNRELIAQRFLNAARTDGQLVLDINHNLVTAKTLNEKPGYLHRKGATPSDAGYVVIPGSRGDYSYLVRPLPSSQGLYSLPHGAGRKWKRGDCQGRLSHKYKKEDLYQTSLGSRVICNNKELLYDEAPQAYKKCQSVVQDITDAGLAEVVARLRPVLTFKTRGECA